MFTFNFRDNKYSLDLKNNILYDEYSAYELNTNILETKKQTYLKFSSECNLNCVYCFQKFDKKIYNGKSFACTNYLLETLVSNSDEIILFGGEPFLDKNIDIIKRILKYIKESSLDIPVSAFSNGCHSIDYRDLLIEYSDIFSNIIITMDGPKEIHDKRRILKKMSSYDLILSNVKSYLKNNINFSISIIIDQSNINYINELFKDLNDLGKCFNTKIWLTLVEGKHYNNLLNEIDILKSYTFFKKKYKMLYFKTSINMLDKLKDYLTNKGLSYK